MLWKSTITSALIFFLVFTAYTQPEPIIHLERIRTMEQPEKFFVHFDKEYYLPGETIWFKSYLFSGIELSNNSTAIKTELINDSGRVVIEKLLPVFGATAAGNFKLSADLPPGNYLFRAFTRWMMNFGNHSFYEKNIKVFEPGANANSSDFFIYFKPEGGQLSEDLLNYVGLRVVDNWSRPMDARGVVKNSRGDTVNTFTSSRGFGSFELFAKSGETYTVHGVVAGKEKTFTLPRAVKAIRLQVREHSKGKEFVITNKYEQQPAYIIGAIENNFVFQSQLPKGENLRGIIPTDSVPSGILNIGVFDNNNKLLAARSTFVHSADHLISAVLRTDTVSASPHGKNVFTLSLPDSIEGHFSVAVVEDDKVTQNADNIITRFLFTGDSRYLIHDPNAFLELSTVKQKEAMDLLMLTYESKHNNWNELFGRPPLSMSIKDNNFLSFAGTVYAGTNSKVVLKNSEISLLVSTKDSASNFFMTETDARGNLFAEGLVFEDTATVFFQNIAKKSRDKVVRLQLSSPSINSQFIAPVNVSMWKSSVPPVFFTEAEKNKYKEKAQSQRPEDNVLDELVVTAIRKSPTQLVEERYVSGLFRTMARKTIDFINEPPPSAGGNIFQYLTGRFSFLTVRGIYPDYTVQYRNTMSLKRPKGPDGNVIENGPLANVFVNMLLYLNETPVDAAQIAAFSVGDFALIKVISAGFVGAEGAAPGGVLAFYTKKPEDYSIGNYYSNLNSVRIPGFSPMSSFVAPEYGPGSESISSKDNRSTLYWNPAVTANEDSRVEKIIFYNPDTVKKYKIIVQGITSDAKLLYIEKPVH